MKTEENIEKERGKECSKEGYGETWEASEQKGEGKTGARGKSAISLSICKRGEVRRYKPTAFGVDISHHHAWCTPGLGRLSEHVTHQLVDRLQSSTMTKSPWVRGPCPFQLLRIWVSLRNT